ncbi:hypothetical protein [Rhodovulum marinum]|uniref:hypothetical protein n=1 Tax=Rhodovulum marinum TaxID=320662 RepID=UPI001405076F|nr:hypothetical protein [Rhodovulum marinum]
MRIDPLIEATPALRELVAAPRSRDVGNSLFRKTDQNQWSLNLGICSHLLELFSRNRSFEALLIVVLLR